MSLRRRVVGALVAGVMGFAVASAHAQDPRVTAAVAAARDWLLMTDHGDAAESYKRASARFRNAMDPRHWQAALNRERAPRGAIVQRTVVQTGFQRSIPGVGDGEFAILEFRTSFAQQPTGAETVTLEREADGVWRVVGYLIR